MDNFHRLTTKDEMRRIEMEEDIIQKTRNPEIKFQSAFGGDATLQSLENAGLITNNQECFSSEL